MSTVGGGQAVADPFRYGWRYVRQQGPDGVVRTEQAPLTREDLLHPQEEDFIVQSPAHVRDCIYLDNVLRGRVRGWPGVTVLHDCRVDWGVEGIRPHGPDLVVMSGVKGDWDPTRGTFLVKEMGARPLLVIEVTSPSTREADLNKKVEHYDRAGIPFYAIVDTDPDQEPRQVQLIGYRATPEGYLRVRPDARGRLWLEPVRLWLAGEGERVGCYDEEGNRVPDYPEMEQAVQEALARAEESAVLAEEAIRARQEAERRAAEEARARQEAERARQEAEGRAADLATRLQEIEAELRKLRGAG